MSTKRYILCVDDEKSVLTSLRQELKVGLGEDYSFEIAESGEEGLDIVQQIQKRGHELPVVISDQLMPGMKGDEFLIKVNGLQPKTRKILLTGQASATAVGNALNQANLFRFLSKPWSIDDITHTVREAIKVYYMDHQLEAQNKLLLSINRYAQLLASEIQLLPWAKALLGALLADTQATKAVLLLGLGGSEDIKALRYTADGILDGLPPEQLAAEAPVGILNQVRLERKVVLVPVVSTSDWADNEYVDRTGVQTLYCSPVLKQDKLLGILYLENNQKSRSLDATKVELLNAVVSQMAMSLDNVLLYSTLAEKVRNQVQGFQDDHENMRDSIVYASRIQQNLMQRPEDLTALVPRSFVLFQPKDLLSGDFYWFHLAAARRLYLVAADCTGHGVPGALMSMLGLNLLSQFLRQNPSIAPNQILTQLHAEMLSSLPSHTDGSASPQEGMDAAVVELNLDSGALRYAGARRPAVIIRNGEVVELLPDKQSVGDSSYRHKPDLAFTLQTDTLASDECLYLFSDGFQDQFGKASGKKFTYTRLKSLLQQTAKLAPAQQANALSNRLKLWREDLPQTDDIMLIGLKPF